MRMSLLKNKTFTAIIKDVLYIITAVSISEALALAKRAEDNYPVVSQADIDKYQLKEVTGGKD